MDGLRRRPQGRTALSRAATLSPPLPASRIAEVIERHYETQYQTEEQIKALQKYELTSFIDVKSAMFHGLI